MRRLALMLCALACAPTLRAASFAVDRLDDAVDMLPGDGMCLAIGGGCTLRAAIQESNALAGPDTLQLAAGSHVLSLPGIDEDLSSQGDLDVTDALTIEGAGPLVTVIDGGALDRVLDVLPADSARAVALRDLSLRNGRLDSFSQNSGGGAGLRVGRQVQLLIERVDIRNNVSSTFVDAMGLSNRGCINGQRLRLLDNFDPDQTGNERARAGCAAHRTSAVPPRVCRARYRLQRSSRSVRQWYRPSRPASWSGRSIAGKCRYRSVRCCRAAPGAIAGGGRPDR